VRQLRVLRATLLAIFVTTAGLANALAGDLSDAEIRSTVGDFLQATQSYQAGFQQQVVATDGRIVEEGAGQFWLKRPGQLRWHYDQPWERDIAANETKIWMYDAELEQLTVRSAAGALAATPAALLVGDVDALDSYELSGSQDSGQAVTDIRLLPKDTSGDFAEIGLQFSDNLLRQLILFDRFGQRTQIEFIDIQLNQPIDAVVFEIIVPEGADVIDESEI
jgi:outer membrane lipoprotein carrier protein